MHSFIKRRKIEPLLIAHTQDIPVNNFNKDTFTWPIKETIKSNVVDLFQYITPCCGYIKFNKGNDIVYKSAVACGVRGYYKDSNDQKFWKIDVFTHLINIRTNDEAKASTFILDCLGNDEKYTCRGGAVTPTPSRFASECKKKHLEYVTYDMDLAQRIDNTFDTLKEKKEDFACLLAKENVCYQTLPVFVLSNPNGGNKFICWWNRIQEIDKTGEICITLSRYLSFDGV